MPKVLKIEKMDVLVGNETEEDEKRSIGEEDTIFVNSTSVFVRNLPYSTTDAQLEAAFEDVGPIKLCFIVKNKTPNTGKIGNGSGCSGIGFVKFAVPSDASRAVTIKDGLYTMRGRKLRCEVAKPRLTLAQRVERRKVKEAEEEYEASLPQSSNGHKEKKSQASILSNAVKEKRLKGLETKRIKSTGRIEKKKRKAEDGSIMNNTNSTDNEISRRTVILGGFSLKSSDAVRKILKTYGKENTANGFENPIVSIEMPAQIDTLPLADLRSHGCRGSMCSVVFSNEEDANVAVSRLHRRYFNDADGAKELSLKQNEKPMIWARVLGGEASTPRRWRVIVRNLPFVVKEDTLMELMCKAGFVWELNLPKATKGREDDLRTRNKQKRHLSEDCRGFAFVSYTQEKYAQRAVELLNGKTIEGRPMAVDWAISKDRYDESMRNKISKSDDGTAYVPHENDSAEVQGDDDDDGYDDDGDGMVAIETIGNGEYDMIKKTLNSVLQKKDIGLSCDQVVDRNKKKNDVDVSQKGLYMSNQFQETTTLYVRNIPTDSAPRYVAKAISKYCDVISCRFVKNKVTGLPKGSAFVDVTSKIAAEACVTAAAGESSMKGKDGLPARDGVYVGNQRLLITLAVDPADAKVMMLREQKKHNYKDAATDIAKHPTTSRQTNVKDKRNLHLLEEGRILQGSASAVGMSKHDEIARERSWKERQTQLVSPDFYISPTRIVLRNLPLKMGNDGLRRLCDNAVRARATKQVPEITSSHMIFDKERRNADGSPRSRGIGFVEFSKHEHALTALRHLNNNPDIYGSDRRPIVEFSVENIKMKRRMEAKRRRRNDSTQNANPDALYAEDSEMKEEDLDVQKHELGPAEEVDPPERPRMSKSKKRRENRKKNEAKGRVFQEG